MLQQADFINDHQNVMKGTDALTTNAVYPFPVF